MCMRFGGDGARNALDSAYSSTASRASKIASNARKAQDSISNYNIFMCIGVRVIDN